MNATPIRSLAPRTRPALAADNDRAAAPVVVVFRKLRRFTFERGMGRFLENKDSASLKRDKGEQEYDSTRPKEYWQPIFRTIMLAERPLHNGESRLSETGALA